MQINMGNDLFLPFQIYAGRINPYFTIEKRLVFLQSNEAAYARIIQDVWDQVFLFSNEHLPMHVHIKNADGSAKYEIDPVMLVENKGMKFKDLRLAESIIEENKDIIIEKWKEYFTK